MWLLFKQCSVFILLWLSLQSEFCWEQNTQRITIRLCIYSGIKGKIQIHNSKVPCSCWHLYSYTYLQCDSPVIFLSSPSPSLSSSPPPTAASLMPSYYPELLAAYLDVPSLLSTPVETPPWRTGRESGRDRDETHTKRCGGRGGKGIKGKEWKWEEPKECVVKECGLLLCRPTSSCCSVSTSLLMWVTLFSSSIFILAISISN